jgi:hypothetical protein
MLRKKPSEKEETGRRNNDFFSGLLSGRGFVCMDEGATLAADKPRVANIERA